jgi:hypothetical protein
MYSFTASERGIRGIPGIAWKNIVDDYGAVGDGVTSSFTAFKAFNDWALEQTGWVGLVIPPGDYIATGTYIPTGPGGWPPFHAAPFFGIKKLIVLGYGASLNVLHGAAVPNNNANRALIYSVDAGSTTLELIDEEKASLFLPGAMILLGGLDIQGFGYPPNPHYFEWCRIASIDGALIHLTEPIKYSYKDDWPNYFMGHQFELGTIGAASIVRTIPGWDCEHKIYGLEGSTDGQVYYFLRKAEMFDVKNDAHGWIIGACENNKIVNMAHTQTLMEVDKLTSKGLIGEYEPSSRSIKVQSSSVDELEIRGGSRIIDGTARNMLIHGGSSPSIRFGPIAYGNSDQITIRNHIIGEILGAPGLGINLGDNMSYEGDGVFRYQGSSPSQFLVPNAVCIIRTSSPFFNHSPFRITRVWSESGETGGAVLIDTTLTGSELPAIDGQTNTAIYRHQAPSLTVENCTGCPEALELSLVPPKSPYGIFKKRTLNGLNTSDGTMGFLMGRLVHLKINVTQAYTGVQSTLALRIGGQFGGWIVHADMTQSRPTASVNLKIAGERIITASGVTGSQTGDSNLSAFTGGVWMPHNFGFNVDMSQNISAESGAVRPIVSVEILTDQEIPAAA